MPFRALIHALVAGALASTELAAQVVVVDEGTFIVTRGGRTVGREEFTIRTTPGPAGSMYVAQGNGTRDNRRLTSALSSDATGHPVRYSMEVRREASIDESLVAQVVSGQLLIRSRTPRGESEHQLVIDPGAILVDDEVWHQHLFVVRAAAAGVAFVVIPRRNVQQRWRVAEEGLDTLEIGGRRAPSRRLVVRPEGGGERYIWLDASGRILRIAIAGGPEATRDLVAR